MEVNWGRRWELVNGGVIREALAVERHVAARIPTQRGLLEFPFRSAHHVPCSIQI